MDELAIARLAVERGVLASAHLEECLHWQRSLAIQARPGQGGAPAPPPSLLALLQHRGFLTADGLARIMSELRPGQPAPPSMATAVARAPGADRYQQGVTHAMPAIHSPAPGSVVYRGAPMHHHQGHAPPSPGVTPAPGTRGFSPGHTPDAAPKSSAKLSLSLAPGQRLGRYQIQRVLGRGGMGVVYLARDEAIDRLVALKTLLIADETDQTRVARFTREAKAAARLHHPNVVGIHDVGESDGISYFTMDYIDGQSLTELLASERLRNAGGGADGNGGNARRASSGRRVLSQKHRRRGGLAPERAASIMRDTARAIDHAHKQGIIHRDVKPQNILIDGNGKPFIMDFGLAREVGGKGLTISGQVMGTPAYMAPEQARNSHMANERSDVYSLGAVLYEALCGDPPFEGSTPYNVLSKVMQEEPPSLRKKNPQVPADLERICFKALEKDPAARYPSANALAADLDAFLRGEAVTARGGVGSIRRAGKRLFRWKGATVVAVGLLMVLSAGFGWWIIREREARRQAELETQRAEAAAAEERKRKEREDADRRAKEDADRLARETLREHQETVADLLERVSTAASVEDKIGLYDQIIAHEGTAERYLQRARLHLRRGRERPSADAKQSWSSAREDLEQAIADAPDDSTRARALLAYVMTHHAESGDASARQEGFTHADRVVADAPAGSWEASFGRALQRLRAEDHAAIVREITPCVDDAHDGVLALWVRAMGSFAAGRVPESLRDAERVVADSPRWGSAIAHRGACRIATGDLPGGMADLDLAIRLDPQNATARVNRGLNRLRARDYRGTIEDLTIALEEDPDDRTLLSFRGQARLLSGDAAGACADIDRLCQLNPAVAPYHQNRGLAYLAAGQPRIALDALNRAIEIEPNRADSRMLRVIAAEAVGQLATARADMEALGAALPAGAADRAVLDNWTNINQLRRMNRLPPLARPTVVSPEAQPGGDGPVPPGGVPPGPGTLPPDPPPPVVPPVGGSPDPGPGTAEPPAGTTEVTTRLVEHIRRATAAEEAGRIPEAIAILTEGLARHPDDGLGLYLRGRMRLRLGPTEAQGAMNDFGRAAQVLTDPALRAECHALRASILTRARQTDVALQEIERALALVSDHASALVARSTIYLSQQKWDLARADLDGVIARAATDSPTRAAALFNRAHLNSQQGRNREALTDLEALMRGRSPSDPLVAPARALMERVRAALAAEGGG